MLPNGSPSTASFLNIFLLIFLLYMTSKNDKAVKFGEKYKNFVVIEMTVRLVEGVHKSTSGFGIMNYKTYYMLWYPCLLMKKQMQEKHESCLEYFNIKTSNESLERNIEK